VVIQPELNMARRDAVDSHDPPGWMRDLDHTIPYDPDGPPGQTSPRESRLPLPATPPRQDHRPLAIPPHARRRPPMARPLRHDVPRH
jgi:hypothetical protein